MVSETSCKKQKLPRLYGATKTSLSRKRIASLLQPSTTTPCSVRNHFRLKVETIVPLSALQTELPLGVPSVSSSLHAGRQSDIFTKRFEKGSVQTDGITSTRHIESACRQRPLSQQQFQAEGLKNLTGTFRIEPTLYRKCPRHLGHLRPLIFNP